MNRKSEHVWMTGYLIWKYLEEVAKNAGIPAIGMDVS